MFEGIDKSIQDTGLTSIIWNEWMSKVAAC